MPDIMRAGGYPVDHPLECLHDSSGNPADDHHWYV